MNSGLTAALVILFIVLAAAQLAAMILTEKEAMRQKIDIERAARTEYEIGKLAEAIAELPDLSFHIVMLWLDKNDYLLYPKPVEKEQP